MEIEDDIATLADKSIFPGDILWVKDSGFYDNRDIAGKRNSSTTKLVKYLESPLMCVIVFFCLPVDELSEGKNGSNKTEEGFRGSLLASD